MNYEFYRLAVVSLIVAIDNALLAGLLLPSWTKSGRARVMAAVGLVLACVQVVCALSVGRLLAITGFRLVTIAVLIWMSIKTVRDMQLYLRAQYAWLTVVCSVSLYTALGNMDNMIWLGTVVAGHVWWLCAFSFVTVPLFVIIALFLADQCEKYGWIAVLGAAMMAWTAASLFLAAGPAGLYPFLLPPLLFHILFTAAVLTAGYSTRRVSNRA